MNRLIEGYLQFRETGWPVERDRFEALSRDGQAPETMVIACSDSRVAPERVFGAAPGELFVVRNVAGLVPPYQPDARYHGTSAALEYAVRVLKVKRIVVLGHAQCGGIRVMLEGAPKEAQDFVEPWMKLATPALMALPTDISGDEALHRCEEEVVKLSLNNLRSFPWIREAEASGALQLEGFRFGIRSGVLTRLDGNRFLPVP
ncbi:MAG: carbonic anhydrase [Rhizobiales bacterium]|nr:carbonic anhydrase [Hyphomicrobiales bacterium]